MNPYEAQLQAIPHFRKFPAMLPFMGHNYISSTHKRLLLIGESNYLPKDSRAHKDPAAWYTGDQSALSEKEVPWINCRKLVGGLRDKPGHAIYRQLNGCLEELGFQSEGDGISHVAYMNCFQRPASEPGESFRACCTDLDIQVGLQTISSTIETIEPELVVFTSLYAWRAAGKRVKANFPAIGFHAVCHPATGGLYWDKKGYAHGREKFMGILNQHYLIPG